MEIEHKRAQTHCSRGRGLEYSSSRDYVDLVVDGVVDELRGDVGTNSHGILRQIDVSLPASVGRMRERAGGRRVRQTRCGDDAGTLSHV